MTALAGTRPGRASITSIRAVPDLVRTSFTTFGTYGVLLVTRRSAVSWARAILAAELRAIDAACSRFRPDSELTLLNEAGDMSTSTSTP
jgi:thiamine biosynthesis lipoprotein